MSLWTRNHKAFDFENFMIDGAPLENVISTNSEERIEKFIEYIKDEIDLLQKMKL